MSSLHAILTTTDLLQVLFRQESSQCNPSGAKSCYGALTITTATLYQPAIQNSPSQRAHQTRKVQIAQPTKACRLCTRAPHSDNECSDTLKKAFNKNVAFQRVLPNVHRRNAAESASSNMEEPFLFRFSHMRSQIPLTEWDLLPQAEITRQPSCALPDANPGSAYACINGVFNFFTRESCATMNPSSCSCHSRQTPHDGTARH
jgi:hypothetical protein